MNAVFIGLYLIILAVPAIFYGTTSAMVNTWMVNETFTHGFLIFPISLGLIWQVRARLTHHIPRPEPRVFALLIPLLLLWFVASVIDVLVIQQLAMIAIIPVIIWIVFGRAVLGAALFPILFLFFSVPIGQELIPVMMDFTAYFTVSLVKLVGIPIYQEGLFLTLPTGRWSVVEECSGVRYLIASVALGTLYAYLSYQSFVKRTVFILFSIIVPILANGLRAFGIVMIGHFSNMEYATGVDHLIYGWVFFGVVIFIMFYIGSFWVDKPENPDDDKPPEASKTNSFNKSLIVKSTIGVVIVLLSAKLFAFQVSHQKTEPQEIKSIAMPDHFNGWQYMSDRSMRWSPFFESPDLNIERSYLFGEDLVQVNIGYYNKQQQGAEAVSSMNRLTDPIKGDWKLTHSQEIQDGTLFVSESIVRKGDQQLLVWKWYRIGDHLTPNSYIAKIYDAYNQIFIGRRDAAMITLSTQIDANKETSRNRLRTFYREAAEDIHMELEQLIQAQP